MKKLAIILISLMTNSFSFAQSNEMVVVNLKDIHWKPKESLPPGAQSAVLNGDPLKGSYDFVGQFPKSYTVPEHWHTNDCAVVMIEGSMTISRPGKNDEVIQQGGFFTLPGLMKYVAKCPSGCVFLVHGEKPFDIFYSRKEDDPRQNKK